MATGVVKHFSASKGVGLIVDDSTKKDIFFNRSSFVSSLKTLKEGQKVKYDIENGQKGLQAKNVQV